MGQKEALGAELGFRIKEKFRRCKVTDKRPSRRSDLVDMLSMSDARARGILVNESLPLAVFLVLAQVRSMERC